MSATSVSEPFASLDVPFDRDGSIATSGPIDGGDVAARLATLASATDDLVVLAHGWNNDIPEARALYAALVANVAAQWPAAGLTSGHRARTAVVALFWPSKRFDESDLIAGGAAAVDDAPGAAEVAKIRAQLANLRDPAAQLDAPELARLAEAEAAALDLGSPTGRQRYVAALAALIAGVPSENDAVLDAAAHAAGARDGDAVLADIALRLGRRPVTVAAGGAQPLGVMPHVATGGAAAGFDPLGDVAFAARQLLNLTTYYLMKERAGTVGASGAAPLVAGAIAAKPSLRVHLVGHSFGGRLVTSLANALPAGARVASLSLLQAAYSHYGLAAAPPDASRPVGAYRRVVTDGTIRGVTQITHSTHDWAVGVAYPIASCIAHQNAAGLPFPAPDTSKSAWGGMGASGAMQTAEATDQSLLPAGTAYAALPAATPIRNLAGDAFISSHGDVTGREVAWALLDALARARRTG